MLIFQFILAFGIMLALHEGGHFIMSKLFGIEVEEFGFGLPPRLCKLFTWKGTDFTLNWIPFGAFVKPKGEFDDPTDNSLRNAPAWKQILICLAGPLMNLLTAALLYTICIHQIGFSDPSRVIIDSVARNSAAESAGMLPGDQLVEAGGAPITSLESVSEVTNQYLDREMSVVVLRKGETLDLNVVPSSNPPEGQGAMGIVITYPLVPVTIGQSISAGFDNTYYMLKQYLIGLGQMITGKIEMGLDSIVGPVGMFSFYKEAAEQDEADSEVVEQTIAEREAVGGDTEIQTNSTKQTPWLNRLSFFAMISVCIGVTNLFPIPALDGGRILMLLPELFTGKKVPIKVETAVNTACMMILYILMGVVMFKDIFMMK